MTSITILGSCRQDSLYNNYRITSLKNNISYPHYSKEILQLINFCLNNNIPEEETKYIFRSAILSNSTIKWSESLKNEVLNTDVFIIEIASRISYSYNDKYVHHILYDDTKYNNNYKNKIIVRDLTDEEIENDIDELCKILNNRNNIKKNNIIIVGHIVTKPSGKRYDLLCLLENICNKKNIPFINPVKEITKRGNRILDLVNTNEHHINHYNDRGHSIIGNIYRDFIDKIKV
uniref:Uncharacterized protein n=1 Tax=viral metagenome TaxID=1070528 RepID=A0A6C0F160_9ZZZZ